jgi:hypothetical protein
MNADELIDRLKNELDALKARLVVDDEMMKHLHEIYLIAFCGWYDPNSDAHAEIGKQLWPHISALNDKLKFKR